MSEWVSENMTSREAIASKNMICTRHLNNNKKSNLYIDSLYCLEQIICIVTTENFLDQTLMGFHYSKALHNFHNLFLNIKIGLKINESSTSFQLALQNHKYLQIKKMTKFNQLGMSTFNWSLSFIRKRKNASLLFVFPLRILIKRRLLQINCKSTL